MSPTGWLNALWLALVGAGIVLVSTTGHNRTLTMQTPAGARTDDTLKLVTLPNGKQGLADAAGTVTPLEHYRRVASGSSLSDELLLALAEPERIVALTQYGHEHLAHSYLYGSRPELRGPADVELLQRLEVDLLILNHLGAPGDLERLRDVGIAVFDLGDMRGLTTLPRNIEMVATLLGDRARGQRLSLELQRRMRAVAADLPASRRKQALYVSTYAGQLFGGAAGTSYHDVLQAAGLIDVAAARYRDWIHYDPEQLLALDPELVITSTDSLGQLCRIQGLDHMRACRTPDGVVGIADKVLGNPGLGMLEAAEEIRERVYGPILSP